MIDKRELRFYRWILVRRLPLMVPIVGTCAAAGVSLALGLAPVYRAAATLLVEPPQISSALAPSTVPENAIEQLQIIEQQTMTADNLLMLADRFGIYKEQPRLTSADIVKDMESRAKVEPISFDTPSGSNGAIALSISFEARDPVVAANVANLLADRLLTGNQEVRNEKASKTLQFFQAEVARLNAQLSEEEHQILTFKNAHTDALPDSLDFHRQQQSNLQERLTQISREEAVLRSRRANLQRFQNGDGLSETGIAASPEEQLLVQYRRSLVEQRAVYSEESPTIAALRSRISALEGEIRDHHAEAGNDASTRPSSPLDVQFADIDGQLAFFQQERISIQSGLEDLSKLIASTASNETVLKALLRTSQNTQTEYSQAVARLAVASTGEQIEAQSKGQRLALVEKALVPQDPVRPSRSKIILASLVAGLGLAVGLVIALEMIDNTVRRPVDLTRKLGIEVFAAIPHLRTRQEFAGRRLAFGIIGLVGLAAVPATAYAIGTYRPALHSATIQLLTQVGLGR